MSRHLPHLSVRVQLLLLVLVVALPSVAFISWYAVHEAQESRETAFAKAGVLAGNTAASLDLMMRDYAAVMEHLAARPLVRALDARKCDPIIGEHFALHAELTTVAIRDAQGNLICANRPGVPARERVTEFSWFRQGLRERGFAVGDLYRGQSSGRWLSVLTYPILNERQEIAGFIALGLDLGKLSERLFESGSDYALQEVVDGEGRILMRSADGQAWVGKKLSAPQVAAARGATGGRFIADSNEGTRRLFAFAAVPGSHWQVYAGLAEDRVLADYDALFARIMAIGCGILLFALALAWRLSSSISQPIRELAETAAVITGGNASARAAAAGPVEIQQVAREFNRMLDVQERQRAERAALVSHYDQLVKLARDIFLLIDPAGKIVEANDAATAAYGYTRDELRGVKLAELRAPETLTAFERDWAAAASPGGALFETVHRRKDGRTFPVEVSTRAIEIEGQPYRQSFIRDISERRAAEASIRRLSTAYATLSQTNEAIVRILNAEELFQRVCRVAVESGGYVGAWVGLADAASGKIRPAAIAGNIGEYVRQIQISLDPAATEGKGPAALALRESRPRYCQDFLKDAATEPWHDLAPKYGIRSMAALPLACGAVVVGTLNLYSSEADVFDAPMRALLEEMAVDISFALGNFERESARREAEAKLARSEAYYRGLFANMREGLAYCRMIYADGKPQDFVYLSVNSAFERLTGMKDVIGRRVSELVPGIRQANPELFETYGRVAASGNSERFETYVPGLDAWFSVSTYRLEPEHFVAIFDVITERKRAEAALAQSEARLRAIVETAHDAFILVSPRGELLDMNRATCDLSGFAREDLVGKSLRQLEAVQTDEEIARSIAAVVATGHARFEGTWGHKDGRLLNVEISTTHIPNADGGYFFAFIRDITERKRVEQALREGEARFRSMLEQNIAAMFMIEDGLLTYANRRAGEILGYPVEDLIGRRLLDLVAEQDRAGVAAALERLHTGELKALESEFRALRKDGSTVELGAHASLATLQGKPALLGIAQDIGERTKAQAEIERYIGRLEHSMESTLTAVSLMVELRDPYTAGHERRVGELAAAIGAEMGLAEDLRKGLRLAGYVHDIGKISVPAEILSKPSKLTAMEFELIKGHSQSGYDVLKAVDFPWPVAEVILQHHERLDGSGYPRGLKGEEIILEARIMAVADVVEAMSSHRPYRPGLGLESALAEIEANAGKLYDPRAVPACAYSASRATSSPPKRPDSKPIRARSRSLPPSPGSTCRGTAPPIRFSGFPRECRRRHCALPGLALRRWR